MVPIEFFDQTNLTGDDRLKNTLAMVEVDEGIPANFSEEINVTDNMTFLWRVANNSPDNFSSSSEDNNVEESNEDDGMAENNGIGGEILDEIKKIIDYKKPVSGEDDSSGNYNKEVMIHNALVIGKFLLLLIVLLAAAFFIIKYFRKMNRHNFKNIKIV